MNRKNSPMISVIIPVYNVESYLEQCLDSILNQSYRNLEIILVDDGSTDHSSSLCEQYAGIDERIKMFHKKHGGLVQARKTGVFHASGEYLTYVDADDWIDSDTYEKVAEVFKEHDVDMVLYGLIEEFEDVSVVKLNNLPEGYYCGEDIREKILPYVLCNHVFYQSGILPNLVCKVVKKELLKNAQLKVSDKVGIGEDADCTFQMMTQVKSIQILNDTPYHYRKRYDSMLWKKMPFEQCKDLYYDLKRSFEQNVEKEVLMVQLYQYLLFIILLKSSDRLVRYDTFCSCFMDKKIVLYGAGGFGQEIYRTVTENGLGNICLWVDQRYPIYQKQGLEVCNIDQIFACDYDRIFIAILNTETCKNISKSLVEKGISGEKICYISPSEKWTETILDVLENKTIR